MSYHNIHIPMTPEQCDRASAMLEAARPDLPEEVVNNIEQAITDNRLAYAESEFWQRWRDTKPAPAKPIQRE